MAKLNTKSRIDEYIAALNRANSDLAHARSVADAVKAELKSIHDVLNARDVEVDTLRAKRDTIERRLTLSIEQNSQFMHDRNKAVADAEQMRSRLAVLEQDHTALEEERDRLKKSLASVDKLHVQLIDERATILGERNTANRLCKEAVEERDKTRTQFGDLKGRILYMGKVIAELRGYITRVREDDVVREDLIPVGDPEGQHRLVPKRKHVDLPDAAPDELRSQDDHAAAGMAKIMHHYDEGERERRRSSKWIEY